MTAAHIADDHHYSPSGTSHLMRAGSLKCFRFSRKPPVP